MRDDVRRTPRDIDEEDAAAQPIRIFPGLWRAVSNLECVFCFFLPLYFSFLSLFFSSSGGAADVEGFVLSRLKASTEHWLLSPPHHNHQHQHHPPKEEENRVSPGRFNTPQ